MAGWRWDDEYCGIFDRKNNRTREKGIEREKEIGVKGKRERDR